MPGASRSAQREVRGLDICASLWTYGMCGLIQCMPVASKPAGRRAKKLLPT
jgi:hypothetical protein